MFFFWVVLLRMKVFRGGIGITYMTDWRTCVTNFLYFSSSTKGWIRRAWVSWDPK